MWKNKDIKHAFMIGIISTIVYLACYFSKNILSIVSPQMVTDTGISIEYIGTLSTANMLFYAGGQFINGIIGDKVKVKYMIGGGLTLAGLCNIVMGFVNAPFVMFVAYSISGFFLAMLYAPLVKLIAENTRPVYAEKCCLALNFASLLGVPTAGIVSFFFGWNHVFVVGGVILIAIGIGFYISVRFMEKRGIVQWYPRKKTERKVGSVGILIQNGIIKFTFVAILTGIVRTSVTFWIPTYLSQYLGFEAGISATIYTIMTCVQSVSPYITDVIIYGYALKRNMNKMLVLMFGMGAFSFVGMFMVKQPLIHVLLFTLAIITANGAANVMWNIYCPSLHHTGMVSTATGYLDFMSYLAAGIANQLFAMSLAQIGWKNLILVWTMLMGAGFLISIPWRKKLQNE